MFTVSGEYWYNRVNCSYNWWGFFTGILLRYTLKKVIRIVAVIAGLFIAGLAYLQYQQIASINWDKLEQASEGVVRTLANATTTTIIGNTGNNIGVAELAITNFGIPMDRWENSNGSIEWYKGEWWKQMTIFGRLVDEVLSFNNSLLVLIANYIFSLVFKQKTIVFNTFSHIVSKRKRYRCSRIYSRK